MAVLKLAIWRLSFTQVKQWVNRTCMYIAYVNYSVHNLRKISFTGKHPISAVCSSIVDQPVNGDSQTVNGNSAPPCPLSALLLVYGKLSSVYVSVCIQERSSSEPPAIRLFIKINLFDRSTIRLQR